MSLTYICLGCVGELTNESVHRVLVFYFTFILMFAALLCIILYGLRTHYMSQMMDELDRVRQENEPGRVYFVEAGSGAQRIVPPPLSPPLTEQQIYYPLGQMLVDEARRAAL
ncbi:hypothetical protein Y032_0985g3289 [Ancylostoma ceylanicum]|uniref:Uncharacterized protein n=1 Tax=Ancylostoma ceylanicum TaxID=53326 RepID=A0A016W7F1_9BILA|nr:hypothetical protein Y032_0985g3289 [Ancylostoma ceylanicum]